MRGEEGGERTGRSDMRRVKRWERWVEGYHIMFSAIHLWEPEAPSAFDVALVLQVRIKSVVTAVYYY